MRSGDAGRGIRSDSPLHVGATSGSPLPALPAWKAFAVQFSHQSGGGKATFSGRVEHLHSGRRASFASREELLAKLERLLDEVEQPI